MTFTQPRRILSTLFVLFLLASFLLTACSTQQGNRPTEAGMAALSDMPAEVQAAPEMVQTAYRYAVANPDVIKGVPCYCGCGSMGHTSNYSCYVQSVSDTGEITFDGHALGCSICVDITLETMEMMKQGKTVEEARAIIDQTYGQYGPSNFEQ